MHFKQEQDFPKKDKEQISIYHISEQLKKSDLKNYINYNFCTLFVL